jgi:hypothetical protein
METVRSEKHDTDPPFLGEPFCLEGFCIVVQCNDGGYQTFPGAYAVRLENGVVQPMRVSEYYPYDASDYRREMLFTDEEAKEFFAYQKALRDY